MISEIITNYEFLVRIFTEKMLKQIKLKFLNKFSNYWDFINE